MLSSTASQIHVAPPTPAVDMAVDRQGSEAAGEKRGHEDRGRDADHLPGNQQQPAGTECMGLETWTAEEEPIAEEEVQPGAEEVAFWRKRQFEAVCPQMLEVGEVLAASALKDLIPSRQVHATKSGADHRVWLQGAESSCGRMRSRRRSSWCRMTSLWLVRSASGASGWMTVPPAKRR